MEDTSLAEHHFRGLWRTTWVILVGLIVTLICWRVWGLIARQRLEAQIAAIAALHQPFSEKDIPLAGSQEGRNAAALWRAAFAAIPTNDTCPSGSNTAFNDYPPYPPLWHQMEDRSTADNAKLFELAHRASANDPNWGQAAASSFASFPYNRSRAVANIIGDAVIDAHLHGDDALAIQRVNDLLQLSRADSRVGNLLGRLVGVGIEALCLDRLLSITPDLVLQDEPHDPSSVRRGGVRRQEIEALISRLLDEKDEDRFRVDVIDFERVNEHQEYQALKKARWFLSPLIDLSDARVLASFAIDRIAADADSEVAASQVYSTHPVLLPVSNLANFGKRLGAPGTSVAWAGIYDSWNTSLSLGIETEWRVAAFRRAAEIALSIRLYRADHGDFPPSLARLVPGYLPAIPGDPFLPGSPPIGYIIRKSATPDGQDRPLLWIDFVGDPVIATLPPVPNFGWRQGRAQWIELARWYPAADPKAVSTEPGPSPK